MASLACYSSAPLSGLILTLLFVDFCSNMGLLQNTYHLVVTPTHPKISSSPRKGRGWLIDLLQKLSLLATKTFDQQLCLSKDQVPFGCWQGTASPLQDSHVWERFSSSEPLRLAGRGKFRIGKARSGHWNFELTLMKGLLFTDLQLSRAQWSEINFSWSISSYLYGSVNCCWAVHVRSIGLWCPWSNHQ